MCQALLCDLTLFSGVILTTTLRGKYNYYPHILQATEAHRDEVTCPSWSYSQEVVESSYPPTCSLIIMLFCIPLIPRMLCFNFMYHGKLHEILPLVSSDINKPTTNYEWWLPLGSALLSLASSQDAASPRPCWDDVSDCSKQARPGRDPPTTAVHGTPFVCCNLFCQRVTITPRTMASLPRGTQGTDTCSWSTNPQVQRRKSKILLENG